MLLLLSGEIHEVHQSERLHHDGRLRKELLLVGQRSVQSFASKHRKVTNNDISLFLLETLLCFKNMKSGLFTNNCNLILWFGFYKCFPFNCPRHFLVEHPKKTFPCCSNILKSSVYWKRNNWFMFLSWFYPLLIMKIGYISFVSLLSLFWTIFIRIVSVFSSWYFLTVF